MGPGQSRLFCKVASNEQRASYILQGNGNVMMSPKEPLGEHTIGTLFKKIATLLNLKDVKSFSGHALRRMFCSTLYNDKGVSIQEAMSSARHGSVAASMTYIMRDQDSEAARVKALGAVATVTPTSTYKIKMNECDYEKPVPKCIAYDYDKPVPKVDEVDKKTTQDNKDELMENMLRMYKLYLSKEENKE